MSLTKQEILNILQEELQKQYPDLDFREGSLVYDLTSPFAYVLENIFSLLEDMNTQLSILTAPENLLSLWAEPRVGKRTPGTATKIVIEGTDISDDSWTLTNNNQYIFNTTTVNENSTKELTSTVLGYVPVLVGDQVTSVATLQNAKVIAVTLGKDQESLENYRMRYIESLFIDAQAGTSHYIKNHVMEHEKVGYAGVDYVTSSSSNHNVYVYVTGVDYLPVSSEVLVELKNYYDTPNAETNITPFGQNLEFRTFTDTAIDVSITIKKVTLPLSENIVLNDLQNLSKTIYVPSIFKTDDLISTIDIDDLRNRFSSLYTEYGIISNVLLNHSSENITLNKSLPKWNHVEIITVEDS